ncbi:probable serine/threonine-protein kinase At1g54610 isoform X1 [Arachis duranensis]|uniref:Probable serine/threonine-protein kinase At1g54610 isoform X1 n=1 Tax=Arachis duranensis TaxID=130453 RepID=A0A6P4CR50_ARADU|nr:probable serine/threonine-protein kinase At1g54610 isoform X1 [Arachis duranensis]
MGCVNGKLDSPIQERRLNRLKKEYAYANPKLTSSSSTSTMKLKSYDNHSSNRKVSVSHPKDNYSKLRTGGYRYTDKEKEKTGKKKTEKAVAANDIGKLMEEESKLSEDNMKKKNKFAGYEVGEGWPKWLADNIPKEVLSALVAKSADSYEKLDKIGRGTYSNVYKARDKDTGKIVALKKVRFDTSDSESIKFMAREIMILQKLDHPNVIKLRGLATSRMQYSLYLVFDYMQCDLSRIISRPDERLTEPHIKCYMQQLLAGLQHCHERGIIHRDIKSSNLLIDRRGSLKIADFGLANVKHQGPLTNRVVTLWYRAPELLLGSTDYGYNIDLWSAGCLLAEMFVGRPFMPGRTEVEQLHLIFKLCGSPPEDYWIKMKLRSSFLPSQHYKPNYEDYFQGFPSSSLDLLTTLLHLDPACRGSAASALETEFFKTSPLACDPSTLPVIYKEEDERSHKRRKRRKGHNNKGQISSKTRTTGTNVSEKNQTAEQSSKEQKIQVEEKGSSINTSLQLIEEKSMNTSTSMSPIFLSTERKSPKTEGHPNALKNIKNYTLLQASFDIMNRNEGNELGPLRRSFSALEFRLDHLEKLSSLYGPNKNLGLGI